MKETSNTKTSFTKKSALEKTMNILGLICIVLGIFLIIMSFHKETLDDNYIIEKKTEYKAEDPGKLSEGEYLVTKDTDYQKEGVYKLVFRNYFNDKKSNTLLEKSSVQIVDIIGAGYTLNRPNGKINNMDYKIQNREGKNTELYICFEKSTLTINLPYKEALKENKIEVEIKLTERDTSMKYITSLDSYYTFTPSLKNNNYTKKTPQSYLIEGLGYIKLSKKTTN